jgi:hypothetical protein
MLPGMEAGLYRATRWDTRAGKELGTAEIRHGGGGFVLQIHGLATDMALAVRRVAA